MFKPVRNAFSTKLFQTAAGMGALLAAAVSTPAQSFDMQTAKDLRALAERAYLGQGSTFSLPGDWRILQLDDSTHIPWFVGRNPTTGELVVSFAGTDDPLDWANNLNAIPSSMTLANGSTVFGVHLGFKLAFQRHANDISTVIAAARAVHGQPSRILFTGHSLGGALASVASFQMASGLVSTGLSRRDIVLYTFGAPRSMTGAAVSTFEREVPHHHLVVNEDDLVTLVPPALLGWTHADNMFRMNHNGSAEFMSGGDLGASLTASVSYHGISEYQARLDNLHGHGSWTPQVSMRVTAGGKIQLLWNYAGRSGYDFVALYDRDPRTAGRNGHLFNQWQYATNGSSHTTGKTKGRGFYAAYVQQRFLGAPQRILAVTGPFDPPASSATVSIGRRAVSRGYIWLWTWSRGWYRQHLGYSYFVQLRWSNVRNAGADDYVALYRDDPRRIGIGNNVVGAWEHALDGTSQNTLRPYSSGFWIAYIEVDGRTGAETIRAVSRN